MPLLRAEDLHRLEGRLAGRRDPPGGQPGHRPRSADAGVSTNFIVANPAVAPNAFEEARFADYDRAQYQISVLYQGNMDGATISEFTTLYNMLMSADMSYLSEQFIDELQPIWDMNTKAA